MHFIIKFISTKTDVPDFYGSVHSPTVDVILKIEFWLQESCQTSDLPRSWISVTHMPQSQ